MVGVPPLLLIFLISHIPHLNHFDFDTLKKLHGKGTDRHTYGHWNSMIESARFADLMKIKKLINGES